MPLSITPLPDFPLLPTVPGVPPVVRAIADTNVVSLLQAGVAAGGPSPLLANMLAGAVPSMLNGYAGTPLQSLLTDLSPTPATQDGVNQEGQSAPQWQIQDSSGNQVLNPDSIVSVEFVGEYRVIKYPIEAGNFEDYNKVKVPNVVKVICRKGGTSSDRSGFLTDLETIRTSTDLYTITTPDWSYPNYNVDHVDYPRRAELGVALIQATIWFEEINVSASTSFSNTQQPGSQDPQSLGTVQTQAATPQQAAAVPPGGPQ